MSDVNTSGYVIAGLLKNKEFADKTISFIKPEYFDTEGEKAVIECIGAYIEKYNATPTPDDIIIKLKRDDKSEDCIESAVECLSEASDFEGGEDVDFLIETAEAFCKDRAMYNALTSGVAIYRGEVKGKSVGSIPEMMESALAVSFDTSIGQDYFDDALARYKAYTSPESKIAFDIDIFNKVTNGGVERKTFNLIAAGVNVGKTMCLCSLAAMYMRIGLNVVYFTQEMTETKILQRVDANMMRIKVNDIPKMSEEDFMSKIMGLKSKTHGKLIVKEHPTGTGNASKFRKDIKEIRQKRGVKVDVMIVDYLQITETVAKVSEQGGSTKYKCVTEELRSLCQSENLVGWSASQFNRGGMDSSAPKMTDIADSIGIAQTADGIWAAVRTEELDALGQLKFDELKSRYGDKSIPSFIVGVDMSTQRLYGVADAAQNALKQVQTGLAKNKEAASKAAPDEPRTPEGSFMMNRGKNKFKNLKE